MTVNRLEDIQRELVTLSNASLVVIEPTEVLSETGTLISGATRHKLDTAQLVILGEIKGAQTQAGNGLIWDAPQAIRWIPNQDTTKEWWGIPEVVRRGYDAAGRDKITFSAMKDPGHVLLHSRVVGLTGAVAGAVGAYADNVAKALVTASFTGTVGGVSLAWDHAGSLVVAADTSEAGQITSATEWEDRWLDEVIDELAADYGFDWELKPSVSGSTITWTFSTKAPRGGTDRTTGASRVVIDGFAGSAPEGERFVDRTGMVNAWADKEKARARTLAASIAKWGTWFGVSGSDTQENLDIDLELSKEQEGSVWTYVAQAMNGHCDWLTHFQVGDLVIKANAKTGEAEASAKIEALEWAWQNGIFQPKLRFGDEKPTLTKKQKEKGGGKGGGRGGSGRGLGPKFEEIDDQIAPIAGLSEAGSINKWPKVDHRHKAQIHTPDAGEVGPHDDGHWVFTSDDASVTITGGGAGTGIIDFAASGMVAHDIVGAMHTVAGAQYQLVGATALNTLGLLTPTTTGAANSVVMTDGDSYITAARFVLRATEYVGSAAAGRMDLAANSIMYIRVAAASRYFMTSGELSPFTTLATTSGSADHRWSTIFGGDVDISTGKGIIHADGNQAGKLLVANGTRYVPGTGGNITAPGADTQVIFNDGGVFGADSKFTFAKASGDVTLTTGDLIISAAAHGIIASDNTAGKVLVADGTRYVPGNISASPGGADTQVQYNDGSSFGGDANFTWNKTTRVLTIS